MGAGGTAGGTLVTTLARGAGLLPTHPDSTWIRGTDSPLILWIPPHTKLDHSGALGLSLQYSSNLGGHRYPALEPEQQLCLCRDSEGTRCPRGHPTFTVLAVARAGMDRLPGHAALRGTLHLLQSDRPFLSGLLQIPHLDTARHLIPAGHGAPVLTWPWLPGDPCLPPGSTTDVFLSTQKRSTATSPRPRQLRPLHHRGAPSGGSASSGCPRAGGGDQHVTAVFPQAP